MATTKDINISMTLSPESLEKIQKAVESFKAAAAELEKSAEKAQKAALELTKAAERAKAAARQRPTIRNR